jgi:GNAT superfamily N-acetyltransferase
MIQPISETNRQQVIEFFRQHWGSSQMIISSGAYDCAMLDGYVYAEEASIIGLVTYVLHSDSLEVISLDSIQEGKGIGSRLMGEVEQFSKERAIPQIELITTNDNLQALKFYQKRGYRITDVIPNAVVEARKVKPTIPLIGNEGIPLLDELKLKKIIS